AQAARTWRSVPGSAGPDLEECTRLARPAPEPDKAVLAPRTLTHPEQTTRIPDYAAKSPQRQKTRSTPPRPRPRPRPGPLKRTSAFSAPPRERRGVPARRPRSPLQPLRELLPELRQLRRDHRAAVRLLRVQPVVLAVVLLGGVERVQRRDLGHDRRVPDLLGLQLRDHFLRDPLLLLGMIEDRGAVLRADVGALAVQRRGVVDREEDAQQVAVGELVRVELDLHDLRVAGRAGADLLVRRVGHVAAGVAGLHAQHATQIEENGFEAPE